MQTSGTFRFRKANMLVVHSPCPRSIRWPSSSPTGRRADRRPWRCTRQPFAWNIFACWPASRPSSAPIAATRSWQRTSLPPIKFGFVDGRRDAAHAAEVSRYRPRALAACAGTADDCRSWLPDFRIQTYIASQARRPSGFGDGAPDACAALRPAGVRSSAPVFSLNDGAPEQDTPSRCRLGQVVKATGHID